MENFRIIDTADKGRSMIATRKIHPNEVILEEKPIFSCQFSWNLLYKYAACDNCMKPLETAEQNARRLAEDPTLNLMHADCCDTKTEMHVKCPQCGITYCSEQCRLDALQSFHATLCLADRHNDPTHPLNMLNETWKNFHLPPETSSIMLVMRILAVYHQATDKESVLECLKSFQSNVVSDDTTMAHKMLGPNFDMQLQTLYPLYEALITGPEYDVFRTPDAFKTFFALIGRNSQGVGTSALANWVRNVEIILEKLEANNEMEEKDKIDKHIDEVYKRVEERAGSFLNNEGSALYLTQSKINHSCLPNAEPTFPYSNNILVLKANETIEAGEEIFISYLGECDLERSRHSRQKELKANYLFECKCQRCKFEENDPDVTSGEEDEEDMDDEN